MKHCWHKTFSWLDRPDNPKRQERCCYCDRAKYSLAVKSGHGPFAPGEVLVSLDTECPRKLASRPLQIW